MIQLEAQEYVSAVLDPRTKLIHDFPLLSTVKTTVAAHDTTGGMLTKITEAAMIARLGIDVYIVKVTTFFLTFLSFNSFSESL